MNKIVMILMVAVAVLSTGSLSSCSSDEPVAPPVPATELSEQAPEPIPDSVFVNRHELERIVAQMLPLSNNGRSTEIQIEAIKDIMGEVALYILQPAGHQGFVIASARKSYWPVLAYSETGEFDINENMPDALQEWLKNTAADVMASAECNSEAQEIKESWRMYERFATSSPSVLERSRTYDDPGAGYKEEFYEMIRIIDDSLSSWRRQGFEAGYLVEFPGISEELREQWSQEAQMGVFPLYEEDWQYLSVVRTGGTSTTRRQGIELDYEWGQGEGFNEAFPILSNGRHAYAGCGNVAMGIIMRYYQKPDRYNWAQMPLESGSAATTSFLYDVAKTTNSRYNLTGTSTTMEDIKNSFNQSFGYNASKKTFKQSTLLSNVRSGRPVICDNHYEDANGELQGHAWIVSGTKDVLTTEFTQLWYFSQRKRLVLQNNESNASTNQNYYYYINWGWNGRHNGYYHNLENAYPLPANNNRLYEMIVDIYPK